MGGKINELKKEEKPITPAEILFMVSAIFFLALLFVGIFNPMHLFSIPCAISSIGGMILAIGVKIFKIF